MTTDKTKKEIDQHTGVETTGHEWDGLKELNNPAPRWWLWIFYLTVIWSVGYWLVYPAWPTLSGAGERGGSQGSFEWTSYRQLTDQQNEIAERRAVYLKRFQNSSFEQIMAEPSLYAFAIAGGKAAFKDNCATCHGTGGAGSKQYPNLNDDDWLWGGKLSDIHQSIKFGIRSGYSGARLSFMPAYEKILASETIDAVADYVHQLSTGKATLLTGQESSEAVAALPVGMRTFRQQCAACHGMNGRGMRLLGAPNLADAIWFYSDGAKESIAAQIKQPKHGVMPNWQGRLSDDTIRQLSIYVHSLGGGE